MHAHKRIRSIHISRLTLASQSARQGMCIVKEANETKKKNHIDLMEHLICDVSNFLYELQNTSNTLKMCVFVSSFSSTLLSLMWGDKFSKATVKWEL